MRRFPMMFVFLLSGLLASLLSAQQSSTATVPSLIRYGGTLKDAQGALISSSTLGVTFAIYKQQDGGAPIWMETQNVATDAGGSYSVLLGGTTATGLLGGLFSQQEQRWLGVQVQGQAEQPRVLMVSVPYAFKAHEADTLGGKSVSDFMPANGANSSANGSVATPVASFASNTAPASNGTRKGAASDGPTNFSGSTMDQIVSVTQSSTGSGLVASAPTLGIKGTATAPSGTAYGVQGVATGTAGVGLIGTASSTTGFTYGLRGTSSSTSGTGVRGIAVATSGSTTGVSGYVDSAAGTAAVFNNAAGGNILIGQNNGVQKFSVDGQGNVNSSSGTYQIGAHNVLSIGRSADDNLFLGVGAGAHNVAGSGVFNTFSGYEAGYSNTSGNNNTFSGYQAGYSNTGNSHGNGGDNTFSGSEAGFNNTMGSDNTFSGAAAGLNNTTGSGNTFYGTFAAIANTTECCNSFFGYGAGFFNTASSNTFSGYQAGYSNTAGSNNTFSGYEAGYSNTTASSNTFFGNSAGYRNTLGNNNTFYGDQAGYSNTGNNQGEGGDNTFSGSGAGFSNILGYNNTFSGAAAGYSNTTGAQNTFYGIFAGISNTTGSNDVYVGYVGGPGTESYTLRLGTPYSTLSSGCTLLSPPCGQNAAYIAGIYGATSSSGIPVYINSNGQLGTQTSSLRFKEQVRDMGDSSDALMKLRPVTFLYRPEYADGERTLQYGLIAEEVAKVYPELVAYDNEGQPYSVRYQYLNTMLLNEVQKQYRRAEAQTEVIEVQTQKIEQLEQRLSRLEKLLGD